ncbi:NAD-dependent epimerase/dehydratase family protein [Halorhabdus sp. CBA1104]|uniref:NAD-dependent epimerase/dehydratase family protein n=1 Tax=unclassified Halorhabdus TaxID=2621901 RepID=UPI0012B1A013|nr:MULTISPECIES: NAD-dependent epimerase/dehydratase family protein [unclassified Halorhabdus]QGN08080.1 NAD-dependent epimerase/dehydratase family protein [Halorhabdus sp. CBA1104]
MDVLIIGGTGVISTGITRQLVESGHEVTLYNRGETDVEIPESVEQIHGDRFDYDAFEDAVGDVDVDVVIDMLCFSPADVESDIRAFGNEIEQLIFTSTIDVYARPPERNPITEDAAREPAVSEYGAEKAAAEDRFRAAEREGAFDVTIIRPWSTYGEGGPVLHTFGIDTYYIERLRQGKPIVVHGDGTALWGPCHRDDVARAFVNAVGNAKAYGETYHVTSEEVISWNQYHQRVASALDAPEPELVHIPTDVLGDVAPERTEMLRDHFQFSTIFDNSKAKRDLDFEYTIDFEAGVKRTVAWLEAHNQIESGEGDAFEDTLIDAWRESSADLREQFA